MSLSFCLGILMLENVGIFWPCFFQHIPTKSVRLADGVLLLENAGKCWKTEPAGVNGEVQDSGVAGLGNQSVDDLEDLLLLTAGQF